jgi:hypothetical protein
MSTSITTREAHMVIIKRIPLMLAVAIVLLIGSSAPAFAASVGLPESFLIGDENGISVSETGDYSINLTDLEPGDVITRTITIRNLEKSAHYSLSMMAEPVGITGSMDLLNNILLRVKLDGKLLYEGRLRGDGQGTHSYTGNSVNMIENALPLGDYGSGDYGRIDLEMVMDVDHINYWTLSEKSTADVRWRFDATNDEVKGGGGTPKTGDIVRWGLYILPLLLLIALALTWWQYRKLKKRAEQSDAAAPWEIVEVGSVSDGYVRSAAHEKLKTAENKGEI